MAKRKKPKTLGYWLSRVILLLCVAIAGVSIWSYLSPTLSAQAVTQYVPYTVVNRTISTSMSFGGTVSILHSEAFSIAQSTTVRELYVSSAQEVSKGDKLMLLESGELLKAGIDGVVNQMRVSAGSWVPANMTIMQVCDLVNMQITMNVDEYDIASIRAGLPCTVKVVSLDTSFDAQIASVNRLSTANGTVAYYTAGIELTVPENVLPGMQATITIPLNEATDVPSLPMEALSFDEDGQPYVYVRDEENGYRMQSVSVGLNDGMYAQITDGIEAGQEVFCAQTVQVEGEGFSISSLYKTVFGETIVIRESGGGRGGRRTDASEMTEGMPSGKMPEGMENRSMGEAPTDAADASADETTQGAGGGQTDGEAEDDGSAKLPTRPTQSDTADESAAGAGEQGDTTNQTESQEGRPSRDGAGAADETADKTDMQSAPTRQDGKRHNTNNDVADTTAATQEE